VSSCALRLLSCEHLLKHAVYLTVQHYDLDLSGVDCFGVGAESRLDCFEDDALVDCFGDAVDSRVDCFDVEPDSRRDCLHCFRRMLILSWISL
jgi:hypothetical protein